jgi:hypothetical protein
MKRHLFGGVALSLVLAASSLGAPQDAGMPRTMSEGTITIRIHNYAQVKPSVLLPATRVAGDILREAGVDSDGSSASSAKTSCRRAPAPVR